MFPIITFSADETFVAVSGALGSFNIRRPVAQPWAFSAAGSTWGVGAAGSDANAGMQAAPFATLTKALSVAKAGDIIYVLPGTYTEAVNISVSGVTISCAPKSAGGGLGTVTFQLPASAQVSALGTAGTPVWQVSGSTVGVTVNGINFAGPLATNGLVYPPLAEHFEQCGLVLSGSGTSGVVVQNCVSFGNLHCGFKDMAHGAANYGFVANVAFGNGTNGLDHGLYCPGNGATLYGNVAFGNAGYGIQVYSEPTGDTITKNLCFLNLTGGILLACSNSTVKGNVCDGTPSALCVGQPVGLFYFRATCNGNVIENNVCAHHSVWDVNLDNAGGPSNPWGNADDYNCYLGKVSSLVPGQTAATGGTQVPLGAHEIFGKDPLFVSPATGDFGLLAGSPCAGPGAPGPGGTASDIGAF